MSKYDDDDDSTSALVRWERYISDILSFIYRTCVLKTSKKNPFASSSSSSTRYLARLTKRNVIMKKEKSSDSFDFLFSLLLKHRNDRYIAYVKSIITVFFFWKIEFIELTYYQSIHRQTVSMNYYYNQLLSLTMMLSLYYYIFHCSLLLKIVLLITKYRIKTKKNQCLEYIS